MSVAESEFAVLLAATENETVPFPLPLLPSEIVAQLTGLLALQLQPEGAVTLTLPVPPDEENDADDADNE